MYYCSGHNITLAVILNLDRFINYLTINSQKVIHSSKQVVLYFITNKMRSIIAKTGVRINDCLINMWYVYFSLKHVSESESSCRTMKTDKFYRRLVDHCVIHKGDLVDRDR